MTGHPPAPPNGGALTGSPAGAQHAGRGRPVPPGYDLAGQWQLGSLDDLGALRRVVAGVVRDLLGAAAPASPAGPVGPGQRDGLLERMLLVTTELASNAIRHGCPPVQVRLWRPAPPLTGPHHAPAASAGSATTPARTGTPGRRGAGGDGSRRPEEVIVETIDHDVDHLPQHTPGHDDGGRGLFLAGRLSTDMSWYATATTKHVWARLRLSHLHALP